MESFESFRRRLDGAAISTYILVVILVPMKIWCRKHSGGWKNIGLDDYISVLALLCASVSFWIDMLYIRRSLGRQSIELGTEDMIQFLYYIYLGQLAYLTTIALTKFSILAFYWRLFSLMARIPILVITFTVFAWVICVTFIFVFACDPVRASWDITIVPVQKCISIRSIYIGGSAPNVITDVIIVLMPLPYVWRLQAPLAQRFIIASMFMLGIFVAIVSAVRLLAFFDIPISKSADVTYTFREIVLWSIVEVNVGLVCACLPSMKPALVLLRLNKLSFSATPPLSIVIPSRGPVGDDHRLSIIQSEQSHEIRRKGSTGGLFTFSGLTTLDSEEGELRISDNESQRTEREDSELIRKSLDTDNGGSGDTLKTGGGITVQSNQNVRTD